MQISSYKKTIIIITLSVGLLSALLGFFLYSSGPRVRMVQFSNDPAVSAALSDSTLTITFDRPIQQEDYTEFIQFEPAVNFTAQTQAQSVVLTFQENFLHDTEYQLNISGGITDQTDRVLQHNYEHRFTTGLPSFAYIERNYGVEVVDDTTQNRDDHIKFATLGSEPEIVFSHPNIKTFSVNRHYLVVAVEEEGSDTLFTVDLQEETVREETSPSEGHITNIALSQDGFIALYTVRPDYAQVSGQYYEAFANRIEALNLQTGETSFIEDAQGESIQAIDIFIDSSGQAAVAQTDDQGFFAISPFGDYDPVLLGTFTASFGIDSKEREIIFRDKTQFVRYDIASGDVSPINLNADGYIYEIQPKHGSKYFSTLEYFDGDPLGRIHYVDDWGAESKIVWKEIIDNKLGLRNFQQNYDGTLLAVHINPNECQFDTIDTFSECQNPTTFIYDTRSEETLTDYRGIQTQWIP